jgi:hypothetical protein
MIYVGDKILDLYAVIWNVNHLRQKFGADNIPVSDKIR